MDQQEHEEIHRERIRVEVYQKERKEPLKSATSKRELESRGD